MSIAFQEFNYWAILVAAVATILLGGLWYSALFARTWARLHSYSPEKLKEMQAKRPPAVFFGVMLVSYLLVALVMAMLINAFKIESSGEGMFLAFLLWLGPVLPIAATAYIAYDKPIGCYVLDGSFQLVFLLMMGAIIGGWH